MISPSEKTKFQIATDDRKNFRVDIFLDFEGASEQQLPFLLREIKESISKEYAIPASQLRYEKLIDKKSFPDGFTAVMEIRRVEKSRGKPVLKFCSSTLPNSRILDNMVLLVDLFPLNEKGKKTNFKEVYQLIIKNGVAKRFINEQAIHQAITQLRRENKPLEDLMLVKGIMPDIGKDAKLDFKIPVWSDKCDMKEYLSSKKVIKGDILCKKTPITVGKEPGFDLFDNRIEPVNGRDFSLKAGRGASISANGNSIIARRDGVVVIHKEETKITSMGFVNTFPKEIQIRIDPLTVVESSRTVEIVARESVEVKGNLKENSKIISEGEVYVHGDVGPNSNIHATEDIIIGGDVVMGTLVSSKSIMLQGDLSDSTLSAKEFIKVEGIVRDSTIYGKEVELDTFVGSTLVAGRQAIIRQIEADESGILSEIKIGMNSFYQMKLNENKEFIEYINSSLNRMDQIFGLDITQEINYSNIELMFLKFITNVARGKGMSEEQMEATKSLIESIPSLKIVIDEKAEENRRLDNELKRKLEVPGSIVITEKINSPIRVQINSVSTQIPSGEGGKFRLQEGKIIQEDLVAADI